MARGITRKRKGPASQLELDAVKCEGDRLVKYKGLMKRTHLATRWIDWELMKTLGFADEILGLCDSIGASPLVKKQWGSFPALSSEFLSSFALQANPSDSSRTLTFQLGNKERSMTTVQLNEAFGFPTECARKHVLRGDVENSFWHDLTGNDPYRSQRAMVSDIVHPCFRIIHRVLGNTIFAREEPNKVNTSELGVLWAMVNRTPIDIGYELAKKFEYLADPKKTTGAICIGGMITPIANYFGVDTSRYTEIENPRKIDYAHLVQAQILTKVGPCVYLQFTQTRHARKLPNPDLTSTDTPEKRFDAWVKKPRPPRRTGPLAAPDEIDVDNPDDAIPPATQPCADIAYFRSQFESLGAQMASLQSHVEDRLSDFSKRLSSSETQHEQDRLNIHHLLVMARHSYYVTHGRHFDPFAPPPE